MNIEKSEIMKIIIYGLSANKIALNINEGVIMNRWKILQIIMIVGLLISAITYLIILGSNMNKSEEERRLEDEEQIKYINDYNERRQKKVERDIYKGDIYYARLDGDTIGSEQNGIRPVLVVQNNIGNRYSTTVIIVPLTKRNEVKLNQPTHYLLKENGNIKYDSIILTEQVRAIDKKRLTEKIDYLKYDIMQEIDKMLMIALGIKNI